MSADERLRAFLGDPTSEERVRANWERAQARRVEKRARSRRTRAIAVWSLASALAVALASTWWRSTPVAEPGRSQALRTSAGTELPNVLETRERPTRVRFEDHSSIVLAPRSRLEVLGNDGERMWLWLRDGSARFEVTPGGPRRWVIEAGLATVEVLGTELAMARRPSGVRVEVFRGSVLVRGESLPEGMRRVSAGERIDVIPVDPVRDSTDSDGFAATEPPIEARAAPAVQARLRPRRSEPATVTPEPAPSATEPPNASEPPPSRMDQADALRASGRLAEAAALLEAIAQSPEDPRDGAMAAFSCGRLELDRLGHPDRAARAFERSIELGLPESLLEDARAARVQAYARIPDPRSARVAAREYLLHHPEGRWRPEVVRWIAELEPHAPQR